MDTFAFSSVRRPAAELTAAPRASGGAPAVGAGPGLVLRGGLLSLLLAVVAGGLAGCQASPREGLVPGEASPAPATAPARDSAAVALTSFRTRAWTVEDGLLDRARRVAQTPDGYLWITTEEGLFRFDGARFVGFSTANVPAFRSNELLSADVLSSGDLWVGSKDGWTYRLREGEWTAYRIAEAFGSTDWVQKIVEDGDGTVWAAGSGRSVARFDGTRWEPIGQKIRDVWTPFAADAEGTIWTYLAASDAPGVPISPLHPSVELPAVVARWDGKRFAPPQDWRLFGFEMTSHGPLFHHPAGKVGAATSTEMARGLRVRLADADGTPRGAYVVGSAPQSAKLVDRAGRVWTEPLISDGTLTVLDGGTEVARIRPEGSKWIESLFEDRQGNVWVLSSAGGLLQVTPEPFRRFGPAEGAPLNAEAAVVAADGSVLVSAKQGAEEAPLFAVRDGAWASRVIDLGPAAFASEDLSRRPTIGLIQEDGRGRRFGTYGSRLARIDGGRVVRVWMTQNGRTLQIPFPDPADPDALWVGDDDGMLWRFDTEAFAPTDSFRVPDPPIGSARPTDVHRAADGRLWVASRGGLVVVGEDGRPHPVDALAGVPVRDLTDGPDGSLWAATETRGLLRIRDGAVDAVGLDEGLPSSHIVAVLIDDQGFVWLSGRTLLYRARVADVERAFDTPSSGPVDVVTLPPSAGHLGSANHTVQAVKAPDGALWIPADRGVTRIDPAAYARQFAEPPPVLVEAVRSRSGERAPTGAGEEIRLPRGDRSPEVVYTALDLTAPDLVRFRTQLVGLDDAWQDQGAARSVAYNRLGPGTYTFRVQARNGGGVWSEPVEATLVVPAFFYETGWFAALCGLGLLAALALGIRARERTQRARRRELESLVEERTEQLRAEKETVAAQARDLETLDTTKSAFFANVSHEFRTPLTLTLGPLDDVLAGEYGPVPQEASEPLGLARRSAERVLDLINQILDVSRLEAGRTPLRAGELDLGAFVEAQVEAFALLAAHKHIAAEVSTPEAPLRVWADPDHLRTILANLLSNAFKFTPTGGAVRVTVEAAGGAACVTVRDTGLGIAAADLPHVFDRFYQAEGAAGRPLGSGIGLALAHELAALHGGTLAAESPVGGADGGPSGSAFTLALPLGRDHLAPDQIDDRPWETASAVEPVALADADEETPASPPPDESRDDDVTTVLVVDDQPDIRAFVRRHLEAGGYRVVEAADGEEALDRVRQRLPDLVVSDVMMPRLDGLGLCRALKADPETDSLPVILLTAKAAPEDRLDGLGEHCDDYLTKPFDPAELRARVGNLIEGRKRLRERFRQEGIALAIGGGDGATDVLQEPEAVPSADDAFLAQVRAAVEAHLGDDTFSVARLAEAVGVSRGHLHRQLTALTGQTPTALLRTVRLERAATLLGARAGTVSEVAYAVGFKSVGHFSDSFLEAYGCRPSAYAEREEAAAAEPS